MAKGITTKGSLRPTLSDKYPNTGPPSKTPIKAAEPIAPVQNTSKSIIGLRCINAGPITVKIYPSNKDVPPQYKVSLFKKALNFFSCLCKYVKYLPFRSYSIHTAYHVATANIFKPMGWSIQTGRVAIR